ncbi:unnamed protein product [Prunus armeniaca]|uniref:Uncharacterized protein n=1 Tax=Prunus armeniaca TaxID=36596 RepID=A0A6J5U9K5_PRUAR|nr:unnamed protein product [Prunus armeniaca]
MILDEHQLLGSRIGMSDIESDYSHSPRAFDGESASESSIARLDSADFEETKGGEVPEVSTDTGSTSSVEVVGADDAHHRHLVIEWERPRPMCRLPILGKAC